MTKYTVDVLMVGGGAAAALAALEAKRNGVSVAFVTKESSLVGGATIMAAGGTSIVATENDNSETFLADILRSGAGLNNGKLARMVAEQSAQSLSDLENHNYLLDRKEGKALRTVKQGEGHAWPRGYLDRREALGLCHALSRAVMRNEITLFPETIITKLLTVDNRAVGAVAMSLVTGELAVFQAKAVLMATGGVGALYEVTTNSSVLTGDGFALALDAGAELVDMEMVQFFPIAFPYPEVRRGKIIGMCSHFGSGIKLINGLGERYMGRYDPENMEMATRDIAARANFTEIKEGRGTAKSSILVDPREHDPAILVRFRTSVPHIFAMFKDVFGQKVADWKEPFEAIPSQHFFMGGIRIDEACRTSVPGLFAVGEVAGGVHGANRLSGVAFTELFVLAPHAGKAVAACASGRKIVPADQSTIDDEVERLQSLMEPRRGTRPFELKKAIQNIMWDKLGPVRTGAEIETAIGELEEIGASELGNMAIGASDLTYNRDRMEAIEVGFMVRSALFIARSAFLRRESRGSHYRTDFPVRNDKEWLKNIVIRKAPDGGISLETENTIQAG